MIKKIPMECATHQAAVAILEDHEDTAESMREVLEKDGKIVDTARNLQEFEEKIKKDLIDVGSVDWNIEGEFLGSFALDSLSKYQPTAGKLVYSVHVGEQNVDQEAKSSGADILLEKDLIDYCPYADKVENAAKLGIFRKIYNFLKNENIVENTLAFIELPISIKLENDIYEKSRFFVFSKFLEGNDTDLTSLLKRRGWWEIFDTNLYMNLSMNEKFTLLFKYVNGKSEKLGRILEISDYGVNQILANKYTSNIQETGVGREIDELTSILAYILRLSSYEPELMTHYWRQSKIFDGSLSEPPWNSHGLCKFLENSGKIGIIEALSWIRNH